MSSQPSVPCVEDPGVLEWGCLSFEGVGRRRLENPAHTTLHLWTSEDPSGGALSVPELEEMLSSENRNK